MYHNIIYNRKVEEYSLLVDEIEPENPYMGIMFYHSIIEKNGEVVFDEDGDLSYSFHILNNKEDVEGFILEFITKRKYWYS